jgi:hypothetical protein
MKWLTSLNKVPPGEFYYSQSGKRFGPSPDAKQVAFELHDFRKGNNLDRSNLHDSLVDVLTFTVNRLPQDSEWLTEMDGTPDSLTPAMTKGGGCAGCGARVE